MKVGDVIKVVNRPSPFVPRDYAGCEGTITDIGEYKVFVNLTLYGRVYNVPLHPRDFNVIGKENTHDGNATGSSH